jgi:hypothetical protein
MRPAELRYGLLIIKLKTKAVTKIKYEKQWQLKIKLEIEGSERVLDNIAFYACMGAYGVL